MLMLPRNEECPEMIFLCVNFDHKKLVSLLFCFVAILWLKKNVENSLANHISFVELFIFMTAFLI